jgi:hypothetical protein
MPSHTASMMTCSAAASSRPSRQGGADRPVDPQDRLCAGPGSFVLRSGPRIRPWCAYADGFNNPLHTSAYDEVQAPDGGRDLAITSTHPPSRGELPLVAAVAKRLTKQITVRPVERATGRVRYRRCRNANSC